MAEPGPTGGTREEFDVEGVAGEPIRLPIAHGPPTGHAWELELPDGVERIEDEPGRELGPDSPLGAAAGGHLRVQAKSGEHELVARLVRPWERDDPARTVRIRLHVR